MAGAQLSLSMMMSCTLLLYTQHWTQYPLQRTYIYRTPATSEWICVAPIPPFFPQRTRRRILVFQKLIPTNNGRGFTEIQIERCPFLPLGGDLVHGLHAKVSFFKHMNMRSGVKILGRNPVQHVARTRSWRSAESPQLRYPRPGSTWRGPACGVCNALRARRD
jgi:hypothetical protein